MESQQNVVKNINLRNSFWSPDYITGIETFLALVKQDNEQLHKEIDFYRSVNLDCFTPFFEGLETTGQGDKIQDQRPLGSGILNMFLLNMKQSGISNITETCVTPLNECLKENKLFYSEIEDDLHAHYDSYQRSWKLAKESYIECQNLNNLIVNDLIKIKQDNQPIQLIETTTTEDKEDIDSIPREHNVPHIEQTIFQHITFPYKLDETLKFTDENDLSRFLNILKNKLTVQKSVISILGTPKEYFNGESLISTLKKIDPKLDTSMFNLSRISQSLLTHGIIQEYQNVGGSYFNNFKFNTNGGQVFQLEAYYIWNSYIFDNITSRSNNHQPRKSYGDLRANNSITNPTIDDSRNISGSFSTWFRKVSGAEFTNTSKIITMDEINEKIVHLNSWQDRYFERYQTLLYSRVQLEKMLFTHCNNYEKFKLRTQRLLKSVLKNFQTSINNIMNIKTAPEPNNKFLMIRKTTFAPIGFLSRDNSFPFTKWVIHKNEAKSIAYETLFSCNIINNDILNTIESIVIFIETQITAKTITESQCHDYWKSDIDVIRATNLEREFIKEFKEMTNNPEINNNVINIIIDRSRNESKFIIKDWIDLIKLFQLELPDSLIPMTLHDEILRSTDFSWLQLITLDKLKLIKLMITHLNKLGDLETFFFNGSDIPFLQYFIRVRGLGKALGENAVKLSDILLNLFKNHLDQITVVINKKTLEAKKVLETEKEEQVPIIKIETDEANSSGSKLLRPANVKINKNPEHKRSISMTLLSSGLKNLGHDGTKKDKDDEAFIPLPFKTSSTPGSPNNLLESQKRKSGISLLTPSTDDLN